MKSHSSIIKFLSQILLNMTAENENEIEYGLDFYILDSSVYFTLNYMITVHHKWLVSCKYLTSLKNL
jgi:hypothetical protein